MKKILFLLPFIFSIYSVKAQSGSFDKRLLSKFSQNELSEMQSKSPETYAYWVFYVANAFQIVDLPNAKSNAHEIKGTVKIPDIDNVNVFDLHLIPSAKDFQYYSVEGSNKLLVIISQEQVREKFLKLTK